MNWEKSVFSNIMWGAYTLVTVLALVMWSKTAVQALGGTSFLGLALALGMAVLAAGCVFLLRRLPVGRGYVERRGFSVLLLGEAALVVLLLVLGFMYRMNRIAGVTDGGVYYEAAFVAEGQNISKMAHGVEYVFLHLLHMVFLFMGNKLAAGIWLQVVLQMLAILLLYFGVRKLAGALPALVMLAFFLYTGQVVQEALTLSPKPMFLLLFAIGLDMLAACRGNIRKWSLFLTAGLWIGLLGYLDAAAFLLPLIGAAAALEARGRKTSAKYRAIAIGGCLTGTVVGFFGLFLVEAHFSGTPFVQLLGAWGRLYMQGDHGLTTGSLNGVLNWQGALILLLCIGVGGYWCSRKRDYISIWILVLVAAVGAQYFGVLTKELPLFVYILLFVTVLAGVGVRESVLKRAAVLADEEPVEEDTGNVDLVQLEPEPESTEPAAGTVKAEPETAVPEPEKTESVDHERKPAGSEQSELPEREPESVESEPDLELLELESEQPESEQPEPEQSGPEQSGPRQPKILLFETPLPMPKPHQKKVLDYNVVSTDGDDDFDYSVGESDDFDFDFDVE